MPCDEISADWAAQRIKGLSLGSAVLDGLKRSLGLNKRPNDGMETKTLLESFRYPAKGSRHDVGSGARLRRGQGQPRSDEPCAPAAFVRQEARPLARCGEDRRLARASSSAPAHVISSAPIRELTSRIHPLPKAAGECAQPSLPRLPDGRADDPLEGHLPRQLDLHPRFEGEGRPHPEFPQLVSRDGARSQRSPASASNISASKATGCGPRATRI